MKHLTDKRLRIFTWIVKTPATKTIKNELTDFVHSMSVDNPPE